ncbi:MAG TPA: DNA-formamidopyrimidine glycosylase family protein [Abditibacteriaceae bacterium]|jgi:formamidopyrimidine-DNA glycosylase
MPEGPEVRRYAAMLAEVLDNQEIVEVAARTKEARRWLEARPEIFAGRRVQSVRARGKHLVIRVDEFFFHSHLMMWGRWQVLERPTEFDIDGAWKPDRRERARILTKSHAAVLFSAPIFEVGEGEPFQVVENLHSLGPDTLPYPDEPPFDAKEWKRRMKLPVNITREIGAVLLDQRICCGIGNYLRAEILFKCQIDPWKRVEELKPKEWKCLAQQIPEICAYAYAHGGATAPETDRERMRSDDSLVYAPNREWGTRHWVFRRTNLPCLVCGEAVRQKRQTTWVRGADDDNDLDDGELQKAPDAKHAEDKTRIIYFCPQCQNTSIELPPIRKKKSTVEVDRT